MPQRHLVPRAYLVILTVAVLLILGEINRVAGQYLSREGHTFSITDAIGPLSLTKMGQWSGWTVPEALTPGGMIFLHVIVDLAFILLYGFLLKDAIGRMVPRQRKGTEDSDFTREVDAAERRRRRTKRGLAFLIGVDLLENVFLAICSLAYLVHNVDPPMGLVVAAAIASTVKWAATVGVLIGILGSSGIRQRLRERSGRLWRSLFAQRFTAILAVVLALLSLFPWGLIVEQVPDIERGWFDDGWGAVHAATATVITLVLAVTFFVIGRKRSEMYWEDLVRNRQPDPRERTYGSAAKGRLRPTGRYFVIWIGIPLAVAFAALFAADIDAAPFWIFMGAFALILVTSAIAEWRYFRRWKKANEPDPTKPRDLTPEQLEARTQRAYDIARMGDILAASFVVIGGLGIARSLAPLVLIGFTGIGDPGETVGLGVAIVVALAGAFAAVFLCRKLLIRPDVPKAPDPGSMAGGTLAERRKRLVARIRYALDPRVGDGDVGVRTRLIVAFAAVTSFGLIGAVLAFPIHVGGFIGGVGVAVGLLGAWTSIVALFTLLVRRRRPLAVFQALGLRSDPALTLFLIVPVLVGQFAGSPTLHAIDRSSLSAPSRDELSAAFDEWIEDNKDCPRSSANVRPLVLVAAEGGGIRAATWTVATLSQLHLAGPCAASSVFLSSGVSGGSVGLAVTAMASRTADEDAPADDGSKLLSNGMRDEIRELSRSAALPAAISGLVVSDPLASTTGVRLPSFEYDGWRDRASLIEESWRTVDEELKSPFDGNPTPSTGWVVFNSTDVRSGCRVVVSQIDFGSSSGSTTGNPNSAPRCDQGVSEPPLTIDLLNYFDDAKGCDFNVDWATAAMLSARFPVVTPAGGVGAESEAACQKVPRLQLIDGGYAENTGLGLLADIAPRISEIVQKYNSTTRLRGEALVVPYLLYIQNSPGGYIAEPIRNDIPELTVPITGQGTGATQVAASSWVQRIMTALEPICHNAKCPLGTPRPPTTSQRTAIMAIGTQPSVTVPLGWALSDATFGQMLDDADRQGMSDCAIPKWSQYLCFGKLIKLLPQIEAPPE